jgi:hypothetical protein
MLLTVLTGHLLVTGWFDASDGGARKFDDLAWGAIEGVLITVGLLTQLWHPERHATGLRQSICGLVALVVAAAATAAFDPATAVVLLLFVVLVVLHPARAQVLGRGTGAPDRVLLGAGLAMAIPLLAWAAVSAMRAHSLPPDDVHVVHQDHVALVAVAVGIALVALLAAVDIRSRVPAGCAGTALLLIGTASLVLDGQADALPGPWALAAVAAGLTFPVLAALRRRVRAGSARA